MKKNSLLLILFNIAFGAALISCNAPRNNPLDPETGYTATSVIEGTVQTFSLPYTAIENVSVYWEPGNTLIKTGSSGTFKITNINSVDGNLVFSKEGFRTDTVFVEWGNKKKISKTINLNKLPQIDSLSIYTLVINQFSSLQIYRLNIRTKISDKDNDIDTVFIQNEALGLKKRLDYNVTEKMYQAALTAEELGITDIEEIIGIDFQVVVKDIFSKEFIPGSDKISRVIKEGSSTVSPNADGSSSADPLFVWTKHRVGYSFKYMIEVYTKDFVNPQLVGRIENISSTLTQHQSNLNLPKGEYSWVIWIIDQFNNSFMSTPSTIIVP